MCRPITTARWPTLRDLDEDFALGKIEPSLYEQDRAVWIERGVQALKALDALGALPPEAPIPQPPAGGAVAVGAAPASEEDLDAAVETAVRRARSQTSGTR
ncbi:MAG: hypothetical protein IPK19_26710 [Chloroflexi bacterium]|nr:hypothetical protein [Chloroflexota bacterium]